MNKKVIIFSAPSGAGKSTIVNHLIEKFPYLEFSISATSRAPRGVEENGKHYYFFSKEMFEQKIKNDEFVEFEEVYTDLYYGTLKSEVKRIWEKEHIIVFDIDVKGGVKLKRIYAEYALSIFVQPPSIDELKNRLISRGTDSMENIEKRLERAEEELSYANKFDKVIVNDNLQEALAQAEKIISEFYSS